MNRKIKFDPDYVSFGMTYLELFEAGDIPAAKMYSDKIFDYLDTHQWAVPDRGLMMDEARRLLKMEKEYLI